MTRGVVILGSTGSIGTQALDVISRHRDEYRVVALAAGRNRDLLAEQARTFGVPADLARSGLDEPGLLAELAAHPDADVVLNAVVGFAGLPATIAALEAGKRLALANKESLIAAGPVVAKARAAGGGEIVPVDSEHSAVWQCLRSGRTTEVARIILTASGGPFRGRSATELATVTRAEALRHPTWTMGEKITIDSSTLMNKGLEVIEAHELFGVDYDRIDVVVHPQSIVHGMVEFVDGATVAQLSEPDMRLPIGLALGAPDRFPEAFGAIDWTTLGTLTFEPPDRSTFRCLGLAYEAGRAGGTAPAILSAANEVAVEAFLAERVRWADIAEIVDEVLSAGAGSADEVSDVLAADAVARERAGVAVERRSSV
ncbi:MAG: 1-deoxy-D-xylulose-5-phosphate reductoisomerase [Actinomycetota bacterium]|jgi:1-deoxy-D-xylulose-5-phosphate reductoisomerase|nr:1-deoxy-D-xylulose-5-phosphate reductoisomerase [Actinomycetota bacterium]